MRQGSPWKATRLMSRTTLKTKGKKEGKKSETRTHKQVTYTYTKKDDSSLEVTTAN